MSLSGSLPPSVCQLVRSLGHCYLTFRFVSNVLTTSATLFAFRLIVVVVVCGNIYSLLLLLLLRLLLLGFSYSFPSARAS